jgi:predicted permease
MNRVEVLALLFSTLAAISPLFFMVGGGWAVSAFTPVKQDSLSRVLMDFLLPVLIFISLYESTVTISEMGNLLAVVLFMVAGLFVLVHLYGKAARMDVRGILLPVIFMNSGFLGFPLMHLWGGDEALNIIIIFDQIYGLVFFSIGILIIGGGFSLKALRFSLTSPLLWSALLGFLFNLLNVPIPDVILQSFKFASNAASPLAAFIVGISISAHKPTINLTIIVGIVFRFVIGFLLGVAAVYLFHVEGMTRIVVLVSSVLPSAVISYVLPARYGVDATDAQGIVIITTLMSIVTIPLSFVVAHYI